MNSSNPLLTSDPNFNPSRILKSLGTASPAPAPGSPPDPVYRTTAREFVNPVDYQQRYPSLARLADLLALRYDANRTRHAYYRQIRLLGDHFTCDPATLTEAQLRGEFFGPLAKQAYDLFFAAVAGALSQKLATDKGLRAKVNGFTAVLRTWNQRMQFPPHIHCLVPGAGLNGLGKRVRVKQPDFLVYLPHLQVAFRQRMYQLLQARNWKVEPAVWNLDWGVHIQPAGAGVAAVKYLGTYVARTAITDARLREVTDTEVTFRWTDRSDHHQIKSLSLPGVKFVSRYLRHVLPQGLRSVRYYGFCHPAAKANRLRVQLLTALPVQLGATDSATSFLLLDSCPPCPYCGGPTGWKAHLQSPYPKRGSPTRLGWTSKAA